MHNAVGFKLRLFYSAPEPIPIPVLSPVDPEVGRVEEGDAEVGIGQTDGRAGQPEEQEAGAHQRHRAGHLGVARSDLLSHLGAENKDELVGLVFILI